MIFDLIVGKIRIKTKNNNLCMLKELANDGTIYLLIYCMN